MTLLEKYNQAQSFLFSVAFRLNKYTKRGKDVPADLLAEFGAAYEQVNMCRAELDRVFTK